MAGQEEGGGIRPGDIEEGLDLSAATKEATRPDDRTRSLTSDNLGSVAPAMAANLTPGQRLRIEDLHNRTLGNRQKSQPEAEPKGERYSPQLEERRVRQAEEATEPDKSEAQVKKRALLNGAVRKLAKDADLVGLLHPSSIPNLADRADRYAEVIEKKEEYDSLKDSEATTELNREYGELEHRLDKLRDEVESLESKLSKAHDALRIESFKVSNTWDELDSLGEDWDRNLRVLLGQHPELSWEEARSLLLEQRSGVRDYLFPDQQRELHFAEADHEEAREHLGENRSALGTASKAFAELGAKKRANDAELGRLGLESDKISDTKLFYEQGQERQAAIVDLRRQKLEEQREFAESLYDLNPELFSGMDEEEFLSVLKDYRKLLHREDVFGQYMREVDRQREAREDKQDGEPVTPVELLERSKRGLFKLEDPSSWRGYEGITRTIGRGTVTLINPNFIRGLLTPEDIKFIEEQTASAEQALNNIDMTPREVAKVVKEASDKAIERFTAVAQESMRRQREKLIGRLPKEPQPAVA